MTISLTSQASFEDAIQTQLDSDDPSVKANMAIVANEIASSGNYQAALLDQTASTLNDAETALSNTLTGAETSLATATTAVDDAKTALQAESANLQLIPNIQTDVSDELAKIPQLTSAIGKNNHTFSIWSEVSLFYGTDGDYNYKPVNSAAIDDFDNGRFYCYYDHGSRTEMQLSNHARLVVIEANGEVSQISQNFPEKQTNNGGIGFVPFDDDSCRFITLSGGLDSNASGTLIINQDKSLSQDFTQSYDYSYFYVSKSRELFCVSSGNLVTITSSGAVTDTGTTFASKTEFETWATDNGHNKLTLVNYYSTTLTTNAISGNFNSHFTSGPYYKIKTPIRQSYQAFSAEIGLESVPTVDFSGVSTLASAPYVRSDDNRYANPMLMTCQYSVPPCQHKNRVSGRIDMPTNANGYISGITFYVPGIAAFSLQHHCFIYKHGGYIYDTSSGANHTVNAISFGS